MNWEELQEKLQELAEEAIEGTTIHGAKEANLDRRACAQVYRGPDFLAIRKATLGSLRYYGGFEYVAQEHTMEAGDYVFYSVDSARVNEHWEACEPEAEPELCSYCGGRGSVKSTEE